MEKFELIEKDDCIVLKDIENFDPKHIFECGQAFRWTVEEDNSYTTVAFGKVLNVSMDGNDAILKNTNKEDFENIWYDYLDLGRDYSEIKKVLEKDDILKEAIKFGHGIRILNQDPFETTISFIISANNQIPRIKKSIEIIAENYGEFIENYRGKDYYAFPSPEKLSKVSVEDIREVARVGFRDKRIIETSNIINSKELILEEVFDMDKDEGKIKLMELPGVGPKVSDCILLFAFNKGNAFPVDVWVKRVMEYFYLKTDTSPKKIGIEADRLFGDLAGFAQQYLFYYAREQDIGK